MTTITTISVTNYHDDGYDLIPWCDITNPPVGRIFLDRSDPHNVGLVVRIRDAAGDQEWLPDSAIEASEWLRSMGYDLEPAALAAVEDLLAEEH